MLAAGAECLAVATFDEAVFLRHNGITNVDILVMGNTNVKHAIVAQAFDITLTCHQLNWAIKVVNLPLKGPLKIHLKINSGMNRLGFNNPKSLKKTIKILRFKKQIKLEGIFTHFATADNVQNQKDYQNQLTRLNTFIKELDLSLFKYIHFANSAAYLLQADIPWQNAVRIGIVIYGLSPNEKPVPNVDLYPAMQFFSYVSQMMTRKYYGNYLKEN